MSESWYKNTFPTKQKVFEKLAECKKQVNYYEKVASFYTSPMSQKYVKNLDLLIVAKMHSDDLLAITEKDLNRPNDATQLMELGFDPNAFALTKKLIGVDLKTSISTKIATKNKKILTWNPIVDDPSELDYLEYDAEKFAQKNAQNKKEQKTLLEHFKNKYLSNLPKGWVISQQNLKDLKNICSVKV